MIHYCRTCERVYEPNQVAIDVAEGFCTVDCEIEKYEEEAEE